MFINALGTQCFEQVLEFMRVMDTNRDFYWWGHKLMAEETKELNEALADAENDPGQVFKEMADLAYVSIGFACLMPGNPHFLMTEERNKELQKISNEANDAVSRACQALKIPVPLVEKAVAIIHASNMTKINPETGKPDRREDGKILKGPNYVAPDMSELVEEWKQFLANVETEKEANSLGTETHQ